MNNERFLAGEDPDGAGPSEVEPDAEPRQDPVPAPASTIEDRKPPKRRRRQPKPDRNPTPNLGDTMKVIDTNDNVSGKIPFLVQHNVTAVGRYYSSRSGKRIAPGEARAIAAAGLQLFVVFEDNGDPPLDGTAGSTDAQLALEQAEAIGQPPGSAIYFAMEHLPSGYTSSDLPGVKTYFEQIRAAFQGKYQVGVYSDGVVCDALLSSGLCDYAWLSASRGFEGSKAFYSSNRWSLAQQTPIDQDWNGISIDTNEAKPDFGQFVPGPALVAAHEIVMPGDAPVGPTDMPWMDWMRQHRGEVQLTGAKPTPFTEEIFKHTTFGPLHGVTPESCAATVCAALEENGYKSTHSAAAASYVSYGTGCDLKPGCIIVFRWPGGGHHVDFCDAIIDQHTVRGLGGNQGHSLRDSDFLRQYIVATRWPVKAAAPVASLSPSFRRASAQGPSYPGASYPAGLPQRRCTPYLTRSNPRPVAFADAAPVRWNVPDLCRAYSWPVNLAGGGVIAIVELNGGYVPSDLKAFFDSIGQPLPNITEFSIDGTKNNPGQHIGEELDPDIEVALDIEIAAASYYVATGKPATIHLYWASDANPGAIAAAIRAATADGCDVCSISWGSDEANWAAWSEQGGMDYLADQENAALAATQAGMIVLASAGDNDSSDGGPTPANVDGPASCPHVIGCGGTSKTPTSETVWNDNPGQTNGEGTGGGYSTVFPRQSFQSTAPYPPRYLLPGAPNGQGRMVPDIAANADPNTGYWMVVHGHRIPMGGTSAVAPLYAGLFAAFGRKLGYITDRLWANPLCFNDITQGENGAYQALAGPDPCTGLGSPIGSKLAALLTGSAQSSQPMSVSQVPPSPSWTGTITLTYANGVLVGTSQAATQSRAALIAPRAQPAGTPVTVRQGHRYSATITLTGLEQFADDKTLADRFKSYGFTNVNVTGSGGVRQGQGTWAKPDTTVLIDSHLSNVIEIA